MVAAPGHIETHIGRPERLDRHAFGIDYARTLAQWHRRFDAAWPEIAAQGFDERFRRRWCYYLSY